MKNFGFSYNLELMRNRWFRHTLLMLDMWRFIIFVAVILLFMLLFRVENNLFDESMMAHPDIVKILLPMDRIKSEHNQEFKLLGSGCDFELISDSFPEIFEKTESLEGFNEDRNGWFVDDGSGGLIFLPKLFSEPVVATKGDESLMIESLFYNVGQILPQIESDILVYDDIYQGIIYLRKLRDGGIKEYIIVQNETAASTIYQRINFHDGDVVVNSNGYIEFRRNDGRQVFEIEGLKAVDVNSNEIGILNYELEEDGLLKLNIDFGSDVAYPILIDPSIKIY